MDQVKFEEIPNNIPHMHLFLGLKRKFPELRDGHITDSIQRFGLDRDRCEEELYRKMQEQHRGYYSPWGGQSRTGSHSSTGDPNSPLSPPTSVAFSGYPLHYIPSPLTTSEAPLTASHFPENAVVGVNANISYTQANQTHSHHMQPALHFPYTTISPSPSVRNSDIRPVYSSSSNLTPSTTAICFQPIHGPIYEQPAANAQANLPSNESQPIKLLPMSAPVKHGSNDPFVYEPNRRSSADTVNDQRRSEMIAPPVSDMVQFQLEKKSKLQAILIKRLEEKTKLEEEVEALQKDIQSKELIQKADVEKYIKRIEELQQDNIHIQSECDEMIREILEFGESPQAEEGLNLPPRPLVSPQTPPSSLGGSIPPPSSLTRESSGSSIESGFTTPTMPMNPQRAPSSPPYFTQRSPTGISPGVGRPPANSASPLHGVDGVHGSAVGVGAPREENDRQWSCSKCTFNNSSFLNECEICGFPHFAVGTTPPPPHLHSFSHSNTTGDPLPPSSSSRPHPVEGGGACYCHRHNFSLGRDSHGAVREI